MSSVLDEGTVVVADRRRRSVAVAALAAVMACLVVLASVVTWSAFRDAPEPSSLTVGGLVIEVTGASRRADAMMGVGTSKKQTSGPGMAMPGMGSVPGALPHGQERVDVQVELHNTGQGEATLDAGAFELWSGRERVRLLQPTVSDLGEAPLSPGSRMVGTLTFVVAEGTTPSALRYTGERGSVALEGVSATSSHSEGKHR